VESTWGPACSSAIRARFSAARASRSSRSTRLERNSNNRAPRTWLTRQMVPHRPGRAARSAGTPRRDAWSALKLSACRVALNVLRVAPSTADELARETKLPAVVDAALAGELDHIGPALLETRGPRAEPRRARRVLQKARCGHRPALRRRPRRGSFACGGRGLRRRHRKIRPRNRPGERSRPRAHRCQERPDHAKPLAFSAFVPRGRSRIVPWEQGR